MMLSAQQVEQFHRDGFLVLRAHEHKLVDPEQVLSWTLAVRDLPELQTESYMPYYEVTSSGQKQLMRTENFVDYHPGFKELLLGDALRGLLGQLTGEEMLLFKDKINYKLAGGNGFQAHLDAPAYDHIGEIEHTTANIAVDAATLENGYVEVVPGSHRIKVPLAYGGRIDPIWEAEQTWLPVPLDTGDLLMFGSHLAHRSADNKTDKPRASIYATYACAKDGRDLRQRYYADRMANFPPDHLRVKDKDYTAGYKRYAFAAPFAAHEGGGHEGAGHEGIVARKAAPV